MKETRISMELPVMVEIVDEKCTQQTLDKIFDYFSYIDNTFSIFKKNSEISQINRGELEEEVYSDDMRTVLALCEETKDETNGYFNIERKKKLDPSGLVRGWAIHNAAILLQDDGFQNYSLGIGSANEVHGVNTKGKPWRVGINNPFKVGHKTKVIELKDLGISTTVVNNKRKVADIVSLTVIGPDAYEANRFATAAFAMGYKGVEFIQKLKDFEAYLIDKHGIAIFTKGFNNYVIRDGNLDR